MSATFQTCPQCGAPTSANLLGGLCPACVRRVALREPSIAEEGKPTVINQAGGGAKPRDAWEPPSVDELATLLPAGDYSVESYLGRGGMGAVYKGVQLRLRRTVAIKIMRRDQGRDRGFEERFRREAFALAELSHPNIVSVIDCGEAGPDHLFIVMEFVDGADLMDVIRTGRMTQEMALTLLPQICDALQFAHDHGIVHRDVKPSNILLTRDGRIKMADFGLVKRHDGESSFRTRTGTGMGTPDYAAPEQFTEGADVDHRADIYALGVMIYQMITGELPRGVWKPPSQRAEIDPQWDDIISHAMQADPADRYQKASEIKTDVSSISLPSAGKAVSQPPHSKTAQPQSKASEPCEASWSAAGSGSATPLSGRPAPRPQSKATLLFGLVTGALVLIVGAFIALKQPVADDVRSLTSPADSSLRGTATKMLTPLSSPQPVSAWRSLFTEAEWKAAGQKGRDFKDGLLHLQNTSFSKEQLSADGAIRARIRLNPGSREVSVENRSPDGESLRLVLSLDPASVVKSIDVLRVAPGGTPKGVVSDRRPKSVRWGDTVDLELRIEGGKLTGLLNGIAVLRGRDERTTPVNQWGIHAEEGWYESVEVSP